MLAGAEPFEHDHLRRDDLPPRAVPYGAHGRFLFSAGRRADGVPDDVDRPPAFRRPRTVWSTQTWASHPATMIARSTGRGSSMPSDPVASNVIFGKTVPGADSASTVPPSLSGFCSVKTQGTSSLAAASRRRRAFPIAASSPSRDGGHQPALEVHDEECPRRRRRGSASLGSRGETSDPLVDIGFHALGSGRVRTYECARCGGGEQARPRREGVDH